MAEVTELVTRFSFEGSEAPLTRYNAALGKGVGLLAGMTAALAAGAAAMARWSSSVLQGEQATVNLSRETGVAVERIGELSFIAEQSNSSGQALRSTLSGLASTIGQAAQQGSEDFARLGISVRNTNGEVKNADQILNEVRNRFNELNLSMQEQRMFAESLGIDPSLIQLLNRTDSEMANLSQRARELGVLTEEQAGQVDTYNKALSTMRFGLDGLRRLIAVGVGPELTNMTRGFVELIAENRDWIVNGVQATIGVLADLIDMLGRVWPLLAAGAGLFVGLKVATLGFSGALAVLFSPAVLIAAGIAALLVIVDDLIVAFQGGQSAIADFFQEFLGIDIQPVLVAMVDGVKEAFGIIVETAKGLISSLGDIFSGLSNILAGNFEAGLGQLLDGFRGLADTVLNLLQNMFGDVFSWARDQLLDLVPDWLLQLVGLQDAPSGGSGTGAEQSVQPGASRQEIINQNRNVAQNVEITIRTNDPERAGQAVNDNLQRQMDDAQTQANRGGQ